MEEIDIWRTAKVLIDAHGENAWLEPPNEPTIT